MLLSSNEEKEHLKKQSLKLQDELVMAQNELKKELQKTKLLMDYPFSSVITRPLSATHTRQHINANTARILLLEEQNDKLREGWGSATGYNDDKDGNASSTWVTCHQSTALLINCLLHFTTLINPNVGRGLL
jgi:hypothetical protein